MTKALISRQTFAFEREFVLKVELAITEKELRKVECQYVLFDWWNDIVSRFLTASIVGRDIFSCTRDLQFDFGQCHSVVSALIAMLDFNNISKECVLYGSTLGAFGWWLLLILIMCGSLAKEHLRIIRGNNRWTLMKSWKCYAMKANFNEISKMLRHKDFMRM